MSVNDPTLTASASGVSRTSVVARGEDIVAGICIFFSGTVALTYEICWIRKSSLAYGSTTFAVSTCLAAFFAGLALGSYIIGQRCRHINRPLRFYAWLEIGIGILALLSPLLFRVLDAAYGQLYPILWENFALLSLFRFVLISLVIMPATVLMGGTLPLFCRQFTWHDTHISRSVGFFYGLNTLGAAIGCALCGYLLIPYVGVDKTIYWGGGLNLLIGFIVLQLPRAKASMGSFIADTENSDVDTSSISSARSTTVVHLLFFLVGFVALGSQVLWQRFLSLVMLNSVLTYTLTLTVVLVGIVLGSLLAALFSDRIRRRALVFGFVQVAGGITVLTTMLLPPSWWLGWFGPDRSGGELIVVLLVMLFPAVLSGFAFPLAIRMVVDRVDDVGAAVGQMTAMNTLGGIAGSVTIGFFALPMAGIQWALLLTTLISVLIGIVAWLVVERSLAWRLRGLLALGSLVVWVLISTLVRTNLPQDYFIGGRQLVALREGIGSNMAVVRSGGTLQLEIDQLWQGAENLKTLRMSAHVPALLHPDPKDVLVIGLGPGQTASGFLIHDVRRLDVVEIERELVDLVREHFSSSWMDDPRVRFIVDDGRSYVANSSEKYDLISIEVGQVFRSGAASFYTTEFYRLARRRLKPGGLVCQFVPLFLLDRDDFRTIVATFLESFPQSVLWYNTSELLLIGSPDSEIRLNASRFKSTRTNTRLTEDLQFSYWGGPNYRVQREEVFLAGFLAGSSGLEKMAYQAPIYYDDRPYLEYTTATRQSLFSRNAEETRAVLSRQTDLVLWIQNHLDPLDTLLDWTAEKSIVAASESIRRGHLGNEIAGGFIGLADALLREGEAEEATVQYREALEVMPEHAEANRRLARSLHAQGQFDSATTHYRRSLETSPNQPSTLVFFAHALQSAGHTDEAKQYLAKAIKINPRTANQANQAALQMQKQIQGTSR